MAQLELIVCAARNNVIGLDGKIPWHLKADLQHFKALTMGHPMVMGRRTFESIGRALPGRRNLVLSSHELKVPGIERVGSLAQALALCASVSRLFVIGGERLYREALPQARVLHITRLEGDFAGDTFFPDFSALPFTLGAVERHFDEKLQLSYTFETWLLT